MRFLFLLFYYENISAQGLNQPKIQVDNGHLKFTGIFNRMKTRNFSKLGFSIRLKYNIFKISKAQNGKDIHFVTTSGSNVFINGDDFGGISTRVDDHEK